MTPLEAMQGTLILVATPIGNLADVSARTREAFERADLVACEDTRRTGLLLHQLGIKRKLLSVHDHNERQRLPRILQLLSEGATVAVATDAGTPVVSDPGYLLVREALGVGARVEHVPGPSAPIAALVLSGLPPQPFTFVGFPPPKAGKRRRFLETYAALGHTLILFEAPHRLAASLATALEVFGDRPAAIAREISKLHEETLRGSLSELSREIAARQSVKGECTLVISLREEKSETEGR